MTQIDICISVEGDVDVSIYDGLVRVEMGDALLVFGDVKGARLVAEEILAALPAEPCPCDGRPGCAACDPGGQA